jgi:hypothetical protein
MPFKILGAALGTIESLPIEKDAVRHVSLPAGVADLVALERINRHDAQRKMVLDSQRLNLFGNSVPDKVEHPGLGKILGEGPRVSLAGKVPAATIAEHNVNGVPFTHAGILPITARYASADKARSHD